ncbi:MAG: DNA polymerase domain-containing protein [Sphaerobacter sp.]|nr:DNA polymerase domain-containing protein [Sphaerobacter sp.]
MPRTPMNTRDRNHLLYGQDPTERIVAVERAGQDRLRVFRRLADDQVVAESVPFQPWAVLTEDGVRALDRRRVAITRLQGDLPLRYLVRWPTWTAFRAAMEGLRQQGLPYHAFGNPTDQYLTLSGRTLFRGMVFDDLLRLQLDIETTGFDARDNRAVLLVVALATNRGHREVLDVADLTEAGVLRALTERIQTIDPDVIEGHNLFNFDLPFLLERARQHGVTLAWGRDGSPPRLGGSQRFKAGPRTVPFQAVSIFGRHLVDTYQQIQRYDNAGELESYGLKQSVDALGLTRPDRVFIPGNELGHVYADDRARVHAYALDDVADVALLSELTLPTEFYQSQILPRGLQSVATGGPGEKINYLMTRLYLALGHSLPLPDVPTPYPGGYTEVRRVGVFRPVVKCDVESLYPAIMLHDRIAPRTDAAGVYLDLLEVLTARRLEAKRRARETSGADQARWLGLQSSFKVLINSFYGYLGYSRALFSDYDAARRVTLRGQEIIRQVVEALDEAGAETIEIDTDGVYFRPPPAVRGPAAEEAFVTAIGARLARGITLAHDGSFAGMISLKAKNYALLTVDGRVILKGSSLRSRREEPVLRRFLRDAARACLLGTPEAARARYLDTAQRLIDRAVDVHDLARWETITDKTFTSEANRRLADAAEGERIGERIAVYQRADGSLARVEHYAGDEDTDYLLRRLRDMAARFRPLFRDDAAFDYHFPPLTAPDCAACRDLLRGLARQHGATQAAAGQVIAVVAAAPAAAEALCRELDLPFPVVADGDLAVHARYGLVAGGAPRAALFVTDRYGTIYDASVADAAHRMMAPDEVPGWLEFVACEC